METKNNIAATDHKFDIPDYAVEILAAERLDRQPAYGQMWIARSRKSGKSCQWVMIVGVTEATVDAIPLNVVPQEGTEGALLVEGTIYRNPILAWPAERTTIPRRFLWKSVGDMPEPQAGLVLADRVDEANGVTRFDKNAPHFPSARRAGRAMVLRFRHWHEMLNK